MAGKIDWAFRERFIGVQLAESQHDDLWLNRF